MDKQTPDTPNALAPAILVAAAGLGVLGEILFLPGILGANLFLWTASVVAALLALSRFSGKPLRGEGRWVIAPALLFAACVAWRSSPFLQAIDTAAVLGLLAVAAFRMRSGVVRVGAVSEYLWLAALALISGVIGVANLAFRRMNWGILGSKFGGGRLLLAARAVALALPLVVVFGLLLASADAIFADSLGSAVYFDLSGGVLHVVRVAWWTWVAAGFLYSVLVQAPKPLPEVAPPQAIRLGPIEVATVLGAVDLLFLAFVVFQIRYLFGGAGHVEVTAELTYAEYAREGFFELVAVAALVIPLLLGVHWLLRDSSPVLRTAFRLASAALLALLFVIIASALQRMRVYVDEFGLTQLRFYSTAFMFWLAAVCLLLGITLLRERRRQFGFAALAAGTVGVFALNAINPDAFIVRTNVDRAASRNFDAAYAASLSPDATPTLVAALPRLAEADACVVGNALLDSAPDDDGWRTWNLGRQEAREATAGLGSRLPNGCPRP